MIGHECELCGQHVLPVGETPHYEPAPEQLTRPGDAERIKSLETSAIEAADQIEALSAECERYRREIARLTWRDEDGEQVCRTCCAPRGRVHSYDCPAGEE